MEIWDLGLLDFMYLYFYFLIANLDVQVNTYSCWVGVRNCE